MSLVFSLLSVYFYRSTGCPDLILDGERMQNSHEVVMQYIPAGSCSIDECGTGVGNRLLLKFDGAIPNVGTSDLNFGTPTTAEGFVYDYCHQHWHFNHFMDYQIFHFDNITNPHPILIGEKRAFCLRDDTHVNWRLLSEHGVQPRDLGYGGGFTCENQGIHVGWQDVYAKTLECQWVDVTPLAAGQYKMRAEVNPVYAGTNTRRIQECRYDNNVVWINFYTTGLPTPQPTTQVIYNNNNGNNGNNGNSNNNNNGFWGSGWGNWGSGWFGSCNSNGQSCTFDSDCCNSMRCQSQGFSFSGICG